MSKDVKLSKRWQMSNSQNLDYGGGSEKKKNDTMRFTDIDVNFDLRYEGHQNCPKILSMNILRVFSDHHL